MSRFRVSIDTGGTFTGVLACTEDAGRYVASKCSTDPDDPTGGVLKALATIDSHPDGCTFVHAPTQALNGFLQRCRGRVLLVATTGAGDVCHLARGDRTRLYDIHVRTPARLVPRPDIVGIDGRLRARRTTTAEFWDRRSHGTLGFGPPGPTLVDPRALNSAVEELMLLDGEAVRAAVACVRDERFAPWPCGTCFALSGFAVGLAGMLLASRTRYAAADVGTGFELTAISSAVVRGTSIFGGGQRRTARFSRVHVADAARRRPRSAGYQHHLRADRPGRPDPARGRRRPAAAKANMTRAGRPIVSVADGTVCG